MSQTATSADVPTVLSPMLLPGPNTHTSAMGLAMAGNHAAHVVMRAGCVPVSIKHICTEVIDPQHVRRPDELPHEGTCGYDHSLRIFRDLSA